jgi:hypothetical protein
VADKSWIRKEAEARGYKYFYAKIWASDDSGVDHEFADFEISLDDIEKITRTDG